MKYRKFDKLNWKGTAPGLGTMRFPIIGDEKANIDETEAKRMIVYCIEQGVNYIDTGYRYHEGRSEITIGHILNEATGTK